MPPRDLRLGAGPSGLHSSTFQVGATLDGLHITYLQDFMARMNPYNLVCYEQSTNFGDSGDLPNHPSLMHFFTHTSTTTIVSLNSFYLSRQKV
jgi:hypothetical protein